MARKKRKFWEIKTNWAILMGVLNNLIPMTAVVPYIGLPVVTVINIIAGAFGIYAMADRAGKANTDE